MFYLLSELVYNEQLTLVKGLYDLNVILTFFLTSFISFNGSLMAGQCEVRSAKTIDGELSLDDLFRTPFPYEPPCPASGRRELSVTFFSPPPWNNIFFGPTDSSTEHIIE